MQNAELLTYITVYNTLNISKAAKDLYQSETTVSRTIARIEKELGSTFFIRTNTGLKPTPEGKLFFSFAYETLGKLDDLKKELVIRRDKVDELCIASPLMFLERVIPRILPEFVEKFPNTSVSIAVQNDADIYTEDYLKEYDIIFSQRPIFAQKYETVILCRDKLRFITWKDSSVPERLSASELGAYSIILGNRGGAEKALVEKVLLQYRIIPKIWFDSCSIEVIKHLLKSFDSIAVLPSRTFAAEVDSSQYRQVEVDGIEVDFSLYASVNKGSRRKTECEALLELAKKCIDLYQYKNCNK